MLITLKRLVLAAVCAGMTGAQAYAQDTITARVPFDFVVHGQTFHAGRYEVKMNAGVGTADVISLRGRDGRDFAFVLTMPASGHDPTGHDPALVFTRHENRYVLSQVWESDTVGRALSKS
jgi:hypothetical protein